MMLGNSKFSTSFCNNTTLAQTTYVINENNKNANIDIKSFRSGTYEVQLICDGIVIHVK
jgi:hypothetical protein